MTGQLGDDYGDVTFRERHALLILVLLVTALLGLAAAHVDHLLLSQIAAMLGRLS